MAQNLKGITTTLLKSASSQAKTIKLPKSAERRVTIIMDKDTKLWNKIESNSDLLVSKQKKMEYLLNEFGTK